jgi:hypothetical protein
MRTREGLLAAVVARLDLIAETGDLSQALKLGALRDARRLARLSDTEDLDAWHKIGLLYWYRSQGLPGALGRSDMRTAVDLLWPCFEAGLPIPDPLLPQVVEKSVPRATTKRRSSPPCRPQLPGQPEAGRHSVHVGRLSALGHMTSVSSDHASPRRGPGSTGLTARSSPC